MGGWVLSATSGEWGLLRRQSHDEGQILFRKNAEQRSLHVVKDPVGPPMTGKEREK